MKWHIVSAIIWRHLYNFRRSLDKVADSFYWPAMDIFLWGFTSTFITRQAGTLPNIVIILLSGLILWMIVWRGQYEITVNLLEEMWNQNLANLFASPLRLREWLMGVFILGFIKMLVAVGFAALLAFFAYKTNIFTLGIYLLPFMISLIMTGWAVGVIVAGLIVYYGMRIQTLAWSAVFLIAPFSGVYYPISTLPVWAQEVSYILPTSYIFEGMRSVLTKGTMDTHPLLISFAINFLFLLFGIYFFIVMFEKSKEKGLARLE